MATAIKRTNKSMNTAMTVTVVIAASKLLGFVREIIMASVFGRSVASDAYVSAYGILSIMTLLFSAGISSTFIPIYVRAHLRDGQRAADRYASSILTLYLVCGLVASLLAYVFAPALCRLVYRAPEGLYLTIQLTRLMYPTLAFYAMTGVLYNILNAREKFIPEQLMGFILSGVLIAACLIFKEIKAVAIGVSVVGAAQFLLMIPFMRGHFRYLPGIEKDDGRLSRTFLLAIPALISMALGEINHQVDCAVGSSLGTGVITAINKSYALIATVLGVLVVPITTIMFSKLSKIAAGKNKGLFLQTTRASLEAIIAITLPVILICIYFRSDIIAVAYQHGEFSAADTAFTAPVFGYYIAGVMAFGMRNFLTRVFYSIQDTKTPLIIGVISVGYNVIMDIVLAPVMGAEGLVLATTTSGILGAVLMMWRLHRKMGHIGMGHIIMQSTRMVIAAVLAFGGMVLLASLFGPVAGIWMRLIKMATCALVYLGIYLGICLVLRVREVHTFLGRIRRA